MLQIIDNNENSNHADKINALIQDSAKIVLYSAWLKGNGLEQILPALKQAMANHAKITLISNAKHTYKSAEKILKPYVKSNAIKFYQIQDTVKYFHSKLYLFEKSDNYTTMIGSVNLTKGGLIDNEELSVMFKGKIGDENYVKLMDYIDKVEKYIIS